MGKIEIRNLSVIYRHHKLQVKGVDGFSYLFESGGLYSVLGASGSGKTTLLRAIAGLSDYEGEIFIDDIDAFNLTISERNISFVTQNFALYPHLNIFHNIAFPLKNRDFNRDQIEDRVNKIASELGISHCLLRKPRELSIGQQQRVALARALIKMPSILLLDEPLSNIDPKNTLNELLLIKKYCEEYGITLIYVTHKFSEAVFVANNILIMNDGNLVHSCTNEEAEKQQNEYLVKIRDTNEI